MRPWLLLFACLWAMAARAEGPVKLPGAAGGFYPAAAGELSRQIDAFLAAVPPSPETAGRRIGIALSPHAGYPFSGPVAAYTYKAIAQNTYSTIVILAPSHFYPFDGAAIWPKGAFSTPLGELAVDEEFASRLMKADAAVHDLAKVFEGEHAVEVELPFLQKTFGSPKIVPLLLGTPDIKMCEQLAAALNQVIGARKDVLVLISSDMSHYHTYGQANLEDALTLKALKAEDIEGFWNGNASGRMEMCGMVPMTVGLMLAKLRGLTDAEVLKYANSGDTSGDKSRVVGYGSVVFSAGASDGTGGLNAGQKAYLLKLARQSIEDFVKTGKKTAVGTKDPRLSKVQGAFVTIMKKGQLRGCIGDIIGRRPLAVTVRDMAAAAASEDPRFAPLKAEELPDIEVEISVLSVPGPVKDASGIVLGRDGVIVSDGGDHQGVFLPQVASETGWSKEAFLSDLCREKAGLPADCWQDARNHLYTFTADVFGEH